MAKPTKFLVVGGAILFGAAALFAQAGAPPGPMAPPVSGVPADELPAPRAVIKKPEAKPRNNIMGDWKLNQEQSDDAHAKLQQARENSNSNGGNRGGSGGGGYGGPRIGFPGGGMGGGGTGGNGGGRGQGGGDNLDSIRDKINASIEINLSQKTSRDPEVDLVDESNHKTVFFTDGRKLDKDKSKDASTDEVTAKWDGTRLVTDEKAPRGKFTRTYELSGDGTQMWEEIKVNTGRGNYPVTIRYVYDAVDKEPPKTASQPPAANPANNH